MKLLLDTTVAIDILRGRSDRRAFLNELVQAGQKFAVSVVSVAEVYAGMRLSEERKTATFFDRIEHLPVTYAIAHRAGLIKAAYARRGVTLGLDDMFIAATAIEYGLPLLTDNRKHFDLPELTLYPLP